MQEARRITHFQFTLRRVNFGERGAVAHPRSVAFDESRISIPFDFIFFESEKRVRQPVTLFRFIHRTPVAGISISDSAARNPVYVSQGTNHPCSRFIRDTGGRMNIRPAIVSSAKSYVFRK